MLGMEEPQIREHLIRNAARLTSWPSMREEILEVTSAQHCMNAQPMPMQLEALPDELQLGPLPGGQGKKPGEDKGTKPGEGKGKKLGKEKGKGGKPKAKKKGKEDQQEGASSSDKDKTCHHCRKIGHQEADCRSAAFEVRISDLAKAEGKPAAAMPQEEETPRCDTYLLALPRWEKSQQDPPAFRHWEAQRLEAAAYALRQGWPERRRLATEEAARLHRVDADYVYKEAARLEANRKIRQEIDPEAL